VLPGRGLGALLGSSLGAQLTAAVSATVVDALSVLTPAAAALAQDSAVRKAQFTTLLRVGSYNFTQSRGELESLGAPPSADGGSLEGFNVTSVLALPGASLIAVWDSVSSSAGRRAQDAAAAAAAAAPQCNPVETSLPGANVTFVELRVTPPVALLSAVDITAAELRAYLSAVLLGSPPSAALAQFESDWNNCFMAGGNASGARLIWGAVSPALPVVTSSSASPAAAAVAGAGATVVALPASTVGGIVGGVLAGVALLATLCCCMQGAGAAKKPTHSPSGAAEDGQLSPDDVYSDLYDTVYSSTGDVQPERTARCMQLRVKIVR
jgi:hypothetical protein